jgi:NAD(P)-dependent dehydrogenase (short-subunit alcohol dehydrogenase family)
LKLTEPDKYSRDLSAELKDTNVLVNYLDPGWLKTDMGELASAILVVADPVCHGVDGRE